MLASKATYRITQSYKLPKWAEKKVVMDWFMGEGIGTQLPSDLEVLLTQAAKLHEELEKISLVV